VWHSQSFSDGDIFSCLQYYPGSSRLFLPASCPLVYSSSVNILYWTKWVRYRFALFSVQYIFQLWCVNLLFVVDVLYWSRLSCFMCHLCCTSIIVEVKHIIFFEIVQNSPNVWSSQVLHNLLRKNTVAFALIFFCVYICASISLHSDTS